MRKQKQERIEIESKWGKYKHENPTNRGMWIVFAFFLTMIAIVLIYKLA